MKLSGLLLLPSHSSLSYMELKYDLLVVENVESKFKKNFFFSNDFSNFTKFSHLTESSYLLLETKLFEVVFTGKKPKQCAKRG